jgi:hypothetical protein
LRNARFRCTGPAAGQRLIAEARAASERQYPTDSGLASATPTSTNQRTAPPNILIWSMVCPAPVSRRSGGRSAVSTIIGTWA